MIPQKGFSDTHEIDHFIQQLPSPLSGITGGNTTCITVSSEKQEWIVDMGSGARVLGDRLMKSKAGKGQAEIHIFITHTHWDHICGIPFFKPLYIAGNIINFYSPLADLHERLQYQQNEKFFPLPFDDMPATKKFHLVKPGQKINFENNIVIDGLPLKHPSGSFAYRFTDQNRRFIFATDVEFSGEFLEHDDEVTDSFFQNADLLVMDAQYTLDESMQKFDWGHTSLSMVVNCAVRWGVKNVMFTHHEPSYSDFKLLENLEFGENHALALDNHSLKVHMAREGVKVKL